jgi:hypothetical protein
MVSKSRFIIVSIVVSLMASGCGWWNTAFRNFNVDDGSGAMIDIKQRAILVSKDTKKSGEGATATSTTKTIVCAEPSPDAMSAYAAEVAGKVNAYGKVNAELAGAFQESAAFVGLRTQSIQLLRDALYRACEGYMSGALDGDGYDLLMRRYQKFMVALLGIEQLTGAIKAPPVVINTQSRAEAGKDLPELVQQKAKAKQELEEAQAEKIKEEIALTAEEKKDADKQNAGKITAHKDKIKELTDSIQEKEKNLKVVTEGLEGSRSTVATGSATGMVYTVGASVPATNAPAAHVASAVEKIVLEILKMDDMGQLCWGRLKVQTPSETDPVSKACTQFLTNAAEAGKLEIQLATMQAATLSKKSMLTLEEIESVEKPLRNLKDINSNFKMFSK